MKVILCLNYTTTLDGAHANRLISSMRMDSPANPAPVAIAGAGPTGLALALALARRGIRSTVFEAKGEPSPYSRAILMPVRSLEIFREFGLLDEALRQGTMEPTLKLFDARSSRVLLEIPFADLLEIASVAGLLIIPQDRTEQILLDAVRATGLCDLRFGAHVRTFTQNASGVDLWVDDRESGERRLRVQFLAGCDGAHSVVREGLGLSLIGKTYDARLLLADVRLPSSVDIQTPRFAVQAHGPLFLFRFGTDRWRVIGTLRREESDEHAASAAGISERLRQLAGDVAFETLWASTFRIHSRSAPSFRNGRVFIAGDAAHLSSPAGGMGMNSGIEDAYNLAWKLAFALTGGNAEPLLRSYGEERRSAVTKTLQPVSDLAGRLLYFAPWPVRLMAMLSFRSLSRIPSVRRRLLKTFGMLDLRYPKSAIITGDNRWTGRLAPDCMLNTGGRLLDAARGRFAILTYIATAPKIPAFAHVSLSADETSFQRIWRVRGAFCAIVRPDGYVAWAQDDPTVEAIAFAARQSAGLCIT